MRIKLKDHTVPKIGTTGEVTKFLWFLKTLGNEIRWLETATWKRVVVKQDIYIDWKDITWINNEKKRNGS